jgi:SNF2 family DNA or RNA helicase
MKTSGMRHQLTALQRMEGRRYYALFMEQGTGKTWTILADAERLYAQGKIDSLLVVAPNGVHLNWVNREIPTHMEGNIVARAWRSGAGVRYKRQLEALFQPRKPGEPVPLRVLAINIDVLVTKPGYDFAERFLLSGRAMIALDESSRIKNPDSARTNALLRLRNKALCARIASGTPISNAPTDVFAQMEFLRSGLLGTTSYRAFVAEYAELMSADHPMMKRMVQQNPRAAFAQVIARDHNGNPRWRNLDKLQRLLEPHSFRVRKSECLDLPEKIYTTLTFELDAKQHRAYEKMRDELRIVLEDDSEIPVSELASIMKLQQITSGYVNTPFGLQYVTDGNPRLRAMMDAVEDVDGQFIVWARFREELDAISTALTDAGVKCVSYHGGVGREDREAAVDMFQSGEVRAFIGQPQSGGIGLTLTAAETVIYFSNDFNLETRLQSEDRAHRIGTRRNVRYIDLAAENTIDEKITRILQRKKSVAALVLDAR